MARGQPALRNCAYRSALVVPHALQDPRFAENAVVTGGPREIDQSDLQALRDLAALVEEQLGAGGDR